ncbi:MAG: MAPEG family protein [Gammaproteobacteria bacterium]
MPEITVLYAGILGLMSIAVAFPAGRLRGRANVSIGDGGDKELLLAMRRHANFVEVVPLALIVIGLLEMNAAPGWAIHALGGSLAVFRVSHALGIKADTVKGAARALGAAGSALVMVVASIWAIVTFF